jgi:hypothetical protein
LQRECACGNHTTSGSECAECSKSRLSIQGATRNPEPQTRNWDEVPLIVNEVLHSPGQPLDQATRAFFEPRFGHAFSQVRVHTDAKAAESARAVNALAYTVGRHVVFCSGQYAPSTRAGKNLLAHELAHTIQQAPAIARQTPGPCPPASTIISELRDKDIAGQTETEMQRAISLAQARSMRGATAVTPSMIQQGDQAIRREFGNVLPAGRDFAASVTTLTPTQFAALRIQSARCCSCA